MKRNLDPIGFVTDLMNRNMRLREISPVYPDIYKEQSGSEITLSTWVPFKYENEIYQRHCIEVGIISETYTEQQIYNRINSMAKFIEKYTRMPYNNPELPFMCDRKTTTHY